MTTPEEKRARRPVTWAMAATLLTLAVVAAALAVASTWNPELRSLSVLPGFVFLVPVYYGYQWLFRRLLR
jgi:hypothetical protein